ncbi:MAG: serine hydrolase domain-containing protein [Sphingomonas sp.]
MPSTATNCARRLLRTALAASAAAVMTAGAAAAMPLPLASQTDAGPRSIDPHMLAALPDFVDGVLAEQIASEQVAGAVVTVVYHGKVLFTRGYGYADIDAGVPVDPQHTLFRPGSVSKLFTWVALLQQVEAGRVDLDADVNSYLDFKIPDFQGTPIRVRDLMSHSPGMSDEGGIFVDTPDQLVPYGQWIKQHIPKRVWQPGKEVAYSNYGAALAGYIVERVSGEPYADYVEHHIFEPLGMTSTTFREPLPPALGKNMATDYKEEDGRLVPTHFEYISSIMPAGSASATAPDMARFMLTLLNGGALDGKRILSAKSVALFESNTIADAPDLPGMAHGMLVYRNADPRLVGHAGNTDDFHTDLVLAPAYDLGWFVSASGGDKSSRARTELSNAIRGKLLPERRAPRWTKATPPPPLGTYRVNRRDYTQPADPGEYIKVVMTGDHVIAVTKEDETTAWVQIGPRLFEKLTGARDGGPFDRLEFYGPDASPSLSFASEPYQTYHRVIPGE